MEKDTEKPFLVPPLLKEGDTVLLISPASFCVSDTIEEAKIFLTSEWKLKVEHLPYRKKFGQFSGSDIERLEELQWALDHTTAKAIFCMRGGYGSNRIIDQVNWETFQEIPKWIIGFSDITHILMGSLQHKICCVHGPMGVHLPHLTKEIKRNFHELLFLGQHTLRVQNIKKLENALFKSKIFGGNLTIYQNTIGTDNQLILEDSLLFIEEINEYPYVIDRLFLHLKRAKILDHLKGILIGDMTVQEHSQPLGVSLNNILQVPIDKISISNIPSGHIKANFPIIFGANYQFTIEKEYISLFWRSPLNNS